MQSNIVNKRVLRKILHSIYSYKRRLFCISKKDIHDIKLFDKDTDITRIDGTTNEFKGMITNNWSICDAPNGGYLMSIAISAARKVISFRDPLSMTAYYTNKSIENTQVDISVDVLNETKGSATVSISFKQLGILRSQYIGTFSRLDKMQGLNYHNSNAMKAPILPSIQDCIDCTALLRKYLGDKLRIADNICFLASPTDPFVVGCLQKKPEKEASLSCWVRFQDGRNPCLRSSAFFLDALPPPILNITHSNWVPTFEYTVHFWQRPPLFTSDMDSNSNMTITHKDDPVKRYHWLRCRMYSPITINGMLYTDGELWSEDGRSLLATSRQLARVLTPR